MCAYYLLISVIQRYVTYASNIIAIYMQTYALLSLSLSHSLSFALSLSFARSLSLSLYLIFSLLLPCSLSSLCTDAPMLTRAQRRRSALPPSIPIVFAFAPINSNVVVDTEARNKNRGVESRLKSLRRENDARAKRVPRFSLSSFPPVCSVRSRYGQTDKRTGRCR